ncbi:carboxypeptidase S [Mycena pura]|uniref:Carboxypeptidase S n=1 Tax=Mycena pura TaxID=153505 RepID=A0AAD6Y5A2_9AGAR|nr:carboxypeptidase S [Mycena pura]
MDSKSKPELPGGAPPPRPRRVRWLVAAVAFAALLFTSRSHCSGMLKPAPAAPVCVQERPLVPEKNGALWSELTALHATDAFLMRAVAQLSAAIQIPTETFDEMGPVGEDPRWITRGPFVEHLREAFPRVHASLDLQKVNTYGLIYTWQGSDETLKPLLLMGHYDVVPVPSLSVDQWTFPPYSGHFDGENIWGRGTSDDKCGVIGAMTAIEVLLEKDFVPTRTIVLSFGFDEEAGGIHGAGHLGPVLLERFGPDSFAMIVDEGSGVYESYGALFATPGIAEKGYVNINIEIQTPGGHSSVPPAHTSIGMLSSVVVHLENNAPTPALEVGTAPFQMAQCYGAHGPDVPRKLKKAILRADRDEKALKEAEEMLLQDRMFKALAGTTQAVDIISGGVKSNALPEQAQVVVNHRIATTSSVHAITTRDAELTKELATRFNLSVTAYGELLTPADAPAYGALSLSALRALEPAPVTPSVARPFRLLAGSIRATFAAARAGKDTADKEVFVSPGMMTGNTDTRFNWKLSKHIFRYGHNMIDVSDLNGLHTVDERIRADAFVEMITFFTTLILNADEAEL